MSQKLTSQNLGQLKDAKPADSARQQASKQGSTLDRSLYKAKPKGQAASYKEEPAQQVSPDHRAQPQQRKRATMTSIGFKRKDVVDLSAKMTAANSNSTRLSRVGIEQQSARNKTAQSVFYSEKQNNLMRKQAQIKELSEQRASKKPTTSADNRSIHSVEQRRSAFNTAAGPTLTSPVERANQLLALPRGKRQLGVHQDPKSTTYQGQMEYLDKIAAKYKELIDTEEQVKKHAQQLEMQKHQANDKKGREEAEIKHKLHMGQLADQIRYKTHVEQARKKLDDKKDAQVNKMISEDDTLMTLYPPMRGVPEVRKKEHYKNELSKIADENREIDQATKQLNKISLDKEKATFNKDAQMNYQIEQDNKEKYRKELLMRNLEVQRAQVQHIVQNELQKKIRKDADRLEYDIVHTFAPRETTRTVTSRKNHSKLRKSIDKNNLRHSTDRVDQTIKSAHRKYVNAQKSLAESTHKSSSPWYTNDGIWNKQGFTKTPTSSYGQAFQDPRKVLEAQKELKEQITTSYAFNTYDSMVKVRDDVSLESDRDQQSQHDKSDGASDREQDEEPAALGEVNIETEGDLVNLDEKPYFDVSAAQMLALENQSNSVLSRRSSEDANEIKKIDVRDSLADRSSFIGKSQAKLRSQASCTNRESSNKFRRKLNLRITKTSRQKDGSAFETKSHVSQRSALTREEKREEQSLNILTKRALNQIQNSRKDDNILTRIRDKNGEKSLLLSNADSKERTKVQDQVSDSSSLIKQNIKRTMYSAFPDMKSKDQKMGRLGEMQSRAQLDALKRFIQSMESEIVEKKRIAKEARQNNDQMAGRQRREDAKRHKATKFLDEDHKNEIKLKANLERQRIQADRKVPDIAGNEGYPRIYQMSKHEERQKTKKENTYIASELEKQMADHKIHIETLKKEEIEAENQYLSGWGYRKDVQGTHYATSGNLGMLAGPTRQECNRKERDVRQMKEVWHKANMVKQLKQSLQSKINMLVNEDKLDQALSTAQKQLHSITLKQKMIEPSSSHSLTLPNRNFITQRMKTMPRGLDQNNEYFDQSPLRTETVDNLGRSGFFESRNHSLTGNRRDTKNRTGSQFMSPAPQRPLRTLNEDGMSLTRVEGKRSESVQRVANHDPLGHESPIFGHHHTYQNDHSRQLAATKSQPAHLIAKNGMIKGRNNPNTKTMVETKLDFVRRDKPIDSVNILERIQSKIEEKMTRADTSNGLVGSIALRNYVDQGKKSASSIGGPRRCPNLQRLIEKKKLEEGLETALGMKGASDAQMNALRKGGSILQTIEGGRNEARNRARTGDLSRKLEGGDRVKTATGKGSLYPWEQRLLAGEDKKKLKAN